jgi:hypothetical protein
MTEPRKLIYTAGIYEQDESGWRRVTWSRHSRQELAAAAARRYVQDMHQPTGGSMSWSAWYTDQAGAVIEVRRAPLHLDDVMP